MNEKQKGRLIYICGWVAFGLVCGALTAAKGVASLIPVQIFYGVLVLFVVWNAYLSGIEFGARKPVWKRALMTIGAGIAGYVVIWLLLNGVVPVPG
ncbi:MAG: hypothetical protein O3C57_02450 [Verrucomicrobia bacterium]|nr:hypothetical protein [Verrucomicrobiota bacterium]